MTKNERINRIENLVNSMTEIMREVHPKAGFECENIGDSLYIFGNGEIIAALYLLLHSRCANLCFYLGHNSEGPYIKVLAIV